MMKNSDADLFKKYTTPFAYIKGFANPLFIIVGMGLTALKAKNHEVRFGGYGILLLAVVFALFTFFPSIEITLQKLFLTMYCLLHQCS